VEVPVKTDIKADLTESANTLSEGCVKAASRLLSLFFGKREANVARHIALTAAQTEKDCHAIMADEMEFRDGKLIAPELPSTGSRILDVERQQELENLRGNTQVALDILRDTPDDKISDKEVDPDFFARWRREAKVIGHKELQDTWGRILAEEIREPGTISYRTLDIVKNMKRYEAELFVKVASFVCKGAMIPSINSSGPLSKWYTYNCLCNLQACGLLQGSINGTQSTFSADRASINGFYGLFTTKGYLFCSDKQDDKFILRGSMLSIAGQELLKIIDYDPLPKEAVPHIAKWIEPDNSALKDGVIRVMPYDGERVFFNNNVFELKLGG
jgi:hypothetical protein